MLGPLMDRAGLASRWLAARSPVEWRALGEVVGPLQAIHGGVVVKPIDDRLAS